jgi:hypothetical protein
MTVLHDGRGSLYLLVFGGGSLQASVAQPAEQLICNQQVVGSSPSASSLRHHGFGAERACSRRNEAGRRL